jgi:hypothetical protein
MTAPLASPPGLEHVTNEGTFPHGALEAGPEKLAECRGGTLGPPG